MNIVGLDYTEQEVDKANLLRRLSCEWEIDEPNDIDLLLVAWYNGDLWFYYDNKFGKYGKHNCMGAFRTDIKTKIFHIGTEPPKKKIALEDGGMYLIEVSGVERMAYYTGRHFVPKAREVDHYEFAWPINNVKIIGKLTLEQN